MRSIRAKVVAAAVPVAFFSFLACAASSSSSTCFSRRPSSPAATSETILDLGVNGYNQPAPEFRVFYDNVTVDFP